MNIEELTLGQLKEIQQAVGSINNQKHPYQVGKNYFIQTVTHYYTGKLVEVLKDELVLEEAAWIADTGRFADFIKDGKFNEVEPYPSGKLIIGRGSLIQGFEWPHRLPREQK